MAVLAFISSLKVVLAAIASISRIALAVAGVLILKLLITYAIGNTMLKTVAKAIAEKRQHIKGTHTVYVLIADAAHGGQVFYVGRTVDPTASVNFLYFYA